jgi:acid phosphatase
VLARAGLARAVLATSVLALAGCGHGSLPDGSPGQAGSGAPAAASARLSSPAAIPPERHVVVVIMENHSYGQIIGNPQARFINRLASAGALFTDSHAVTHPSEPNYLALFSGGTHAVTSDRCPLSFRAPNLAAELIAAGKSFAGYAEDLPAPGSASCGQGEYARKHVPWADFSNVPAAESQPLRQFPATQFGKLPAVSFVVPNLCHDMHDCPVAAGDEWLRAHLGRYARWAGSHDSLLIVTWDENDGSQPDRIATIITGQHVRPGRYAEPITHYSVLRTIELAFRLRPIGRAAAAAPITAIWRRHG